MEYQGGTALLLPHNSKFSLPPRRCDEERQRAKREPNATFCTRLGVLEMVGDDVLFWEGVIAIVTELSSMLVASLGLTFTAKQC